MTILTVAICDHEIAYVEKFKEFIACRRSKNDISLFAYHNPEMLSEAIKKNRFDIIMLGKGCISQTYIESLPQTVIIFLSDGLYKDEAFTEMPTIFKYQSGEEILRNMFFYYQKAVTENMEIKLFQSRKELIGFYSPGHTILQTPFALTMAWHLAENKHVLYVNLGECAGFTQWFAKEYTRDLGDLLYLLSVNEGNFYGKLGSTIYTMDNFDYVPPISDSQLLCEAGAEEYFLLTRYLLEKTDYGVIILDFGLMLPGFFPLLEQCSSIYLTQSCNLLENGPGEHFIEAAKRVCSTELISRIQNITLPDQKLHTAQGSILNQWIWGPLGEAVRKVLGTENANN